MRSSLVVWVSPWRARRSWRPGCCSRRARAATCGRCTTRCWPTLPPTQWPTGRAESNRASSNAVESVTHSCNSHVSNCEHNSEKHKPMPTMRLGTAVPFVPDPFSSPDSCFFLACSAHACHNTPQRNTPDEAARMTWSPMWAGQRC